MEETLHCISSIRNLTFGSRVMHTLIVRPGAWRPSNRRSEIRSRVIRDTRSHWREKRHAWHPCTAQLHVFTNNCQKVLRRRAMGVFSLSAPYAAGGRGSIHRITHDSPVGELIVDKLSVGACVRGVYTSARLSNGLASHHAAERGLVNACTASTVA